MPVHRLFIAVGIPDDVKQTLGRIQSELKPRLPQTRMVRAEGMHLTLKFLGPVPEKKLRDLTEALDGISASFASRWIRMRAISTSSRIRWAR